MSDIHEPKELAMEKARAGETSGHMRIVLTVSTILAVICLGVIVISFVSGGA